VNPRDDRSRQPAARAARPSLRIALWLAAVLVIAGFLALGRWQLQRATEKQQMLDAVAAVLESRQARSLAAVEARPPGYDWTAGRGRFLARPALLLDNQRRGDLVGVHVFGVFQPDAGRALLVDLGWLPVPGNRQLPVVRLPEGEQAVSGLLAPPLATGLALGPAYVRSDAGRWLLTRIDIAALADGLGVPLAPRVLRLDPALPLGYARDLDVLPNTLPPERHRGYAVQWFGLALATLIIALYLGFRRRPA
jgi:cytochrome oxidase assembly protein ShyY1